MWWKKGSHSEDHATKDKNCQCFHRSIAFVLILGQFFGLMPIHGITGPTEGSLYFTWKSWKIIYSGLALTGILFALYMCLHNVIYYQNDIFQITAVMFFTSSFVTHLLFIKLARNWPKLMKSWYTAEVSLQNYGWPPKLNFRLKLMTAIILSLAAIEHLLASANNLMVSKRCKSADQSIFEYFFKIISYPQIFQVMNYYLWAGILLQLVNLVSTFSWTYIDLFIMLLSTSLSFRIEQVIRRVESYVETKVSDEYMWRHVKEDYIKLGKLCKKLNEALSYAVLVSFGTNLYFILVQLFNSLRKRNGALEKIYFFYSFGFLIGRTVCVSLYGAKIHDESQKLLPLLHAVSSFVYNIEIRRFMLHACVDFLSLSGRRYFNITRGLIISIAGTIVTYELVLIQFYGNLLQDLNKNKNITC